MDLNFNLGEIGYNELNMAIVSDLLKNKKDEILSLAKKHGAYNVRVFGSAARNEDDEKSDIDFLVDVGENTTSWFPAGLIIDLESLLNVKVDVATEKALKARIRDKVVRESKLL